MNIEQYSPQSGRFLKEDGTYINIADALGGTETGQIADIEKHAAHSGRFIKEDGTVINIAESIGSGGGGGGSGSSDDSAPPIVETYNGQTIQCSMSADRPLQGLNLYATCEQTTTTGAQLFDASLFPTKSMGGATVTNNGDGSFTISGEGQLSEEGFLLSIGVSGDDAKKMLKAGNIYTNGASYVPKFYAYGGDNAGRVLFNTSTNGSAVITNEILENLSQLNIVFYSYGGSVITPVTFFPMFWQTGDGTYEPYTGGKPSPSLEYPQEIQTISDFVVEVKNSMGEDATPQTLNVVIPEQGFYGVPVRTGGNYTDSSKQQWICDEFDFVNKKFIKRTKRVSYDGSEDEQWIRDSASGGKTRFYIALANGTSRGGAECLCDRLIYRVSGEKGSCFVSNSRFYIDAEISISTVELLKDYLNTHQLDVIYPLKAPVEYNLTDEQVEQYKKLRSYYGTTYIDNDAVPACNMQAELVLDTKLYIDSKFTTLAGQILEMGV